MHAASSCACNLFDGDDECVFAVKFVAKWNTHTAHRPKRIGSHARFALKSIWWMHAMKRACYDKFEFCIVLRWQMTRAARTSRLECLTLPFADKSGREDHDAFKIIDNNITFAFVFAKKSASQKPKRTEWARLLRLVVSQAEFRKIESPKTKLNHIRRQESDSSFPIATFATSTGHRRAHVVAYSCVYL